MNGRPGVTLLTAPGALSGANARRLLLLSYHFPPGQATGALRWEQMARVAVSRGWSIDVITVHPDELSSADQGRLAALPPQVRVFGVRSDRPALLAVERQLLAWKRRLSGAGANGARPAAAPQQPKQQQAAVPNTDLVWRDEMRWSLAPRDLRRAYNVWHESVREWGWTRAAQRAALDLVTDHQLIVSCGPPHLVHVAARNVAKRKGIASMMDMRDPWTLVPALTGALASPLWYRLAASGERAAVDGALLVVANTRRHAQELQRLYPAAADRIIPIMNGCDDDRIPVYPTDRFTISYAGNIYIDRDPRMIFRALARVIAAEGLTPENFGLELLGHVDQFGGVGVRELADAEGLLPYLTVFPRLPRKEALERMARATMLLSLPQDVDLSIPSKVFEYTQFPAWLLALASARSATADVLRGSGADVLDPADEEGIVNVVRKRLHDFRQSGRPRPINADGKFSRTRQAGLLFDALEQRLPLQVKPTKEQAA